MHIWQANVKALTNLGYFFPLPNCLQIASTFKSINHLTPGNSCWGKALPGLSNRWFSSTGKYIRAQEGRMTLAVLRTLPPLLHSAAFNTQHCKLFLVSAGKPPGLSWGIMSGVGKLMKDREILKIRALPSLR